MEMVHYAFRPTLWGHMCSTCFDLVFLLPSSATRSQERHTVTFAPEVRPEALPLAANVTPTKVRQDAPQPAATWSEERDTWSYPNLWFVQMFWSLPGHGIKGDPEAVEVRKLLRRLATR